MCSFVVLEPMAEDEPSEEPMATEADPGALVAEPTITEPIESVPEDPTPEPFVTEAVPEAIVSESSIMEPTGEEATLEASGAEARVTEEKSAEEPSAPAVESGKPDTSVWRPGDVFMLTQMKDIDRLLAFFHLWNCS